MKKENEITVPVIDLDKFEKEIADINTVPKSKQRLKKDNDGNLNFIAAVEQLENKPKPKRKKKKPFVFTPVKFHAKEFAADMLQKREKENISFRDLAKKTKIPMATLYRAEAKDNIKIDTLVALINWIEKPLSKYFY